MNFWTGIIIGLFVGASFGGIIIGVLASGKLATHRCAQREREEN